jgi:alkylhydroperoxidase family enzyme
MHGLDAATLAGARHASSSSPKSAAILALALAIVNKRGQISDDALATARRAGVTDTEIVEVVAHVALNVFTNYLNNVAQTTIDFPEVALDAAA